MNGDSRSRSPFFLELLSLSFIWKVLIRSCSYSTKIWTCSRERVHSLRSFPSLDTGVCAPFSSAGWWVKYHVQSAAGPDGAVAGNAAGSVVTCGSVPPPPPRRWRAGTRAQTWIGPPRLQLEAGWDGVGGQTDSIQHPLGVGRGFSGWTEFRPSPLGWHMGFCSWTIPVPSVGWDGTDHRLSLVTD
jgi:hypothetical protein